MSSEIKIAYLGPSGTFTEQALKNQADLANCQLIAMPKFVDILTATDAGEVDYGFVAIENALEGTVNITLDALVFEHDLIITRQVDLDIELDLMAPAGTDMSAIETVLSHPVALAQCRQFLDSELPSAKTRPANSTSAAAAQTLSEPNAAALANSLAAQIHGLEIIKQDVADHKLNKTRFALVSTGGVPQSTGNDKTTIVVFQDKDKPGSLISILQEFAARKINLTRIASRPIKTEAMGNYCFVIEFDGHVADELVGDCLTKVKANHADIKFLGSYPSLDKTESSGDRPAADSWLEQLRAL